MEENTIGESISRLIESIKESPEYKEFRKQSDILKADSDLKHRVDAFRGENYRIRNRSPTLNHQKQRCHHRTGSW